MMRSLKAFLLFWYDFIIGDDWVIAVGVVFALIGTHRLVRAGVNAWWLMPVVVAALLALSLWRLTRPRPQKK
jgi:membrane protein implicated in regulation of membrane protease activity